MKRLFTIIFTFLTMFVFGQQIDSTRMIPHLEDDSIYYINLCIEDTLDIGFIDLGTYTWILSGETLEDTSSNIQLPLPPGAWTITVENSSWNNSFEFRVRAGDRPEITINPIGPLCRGDCDNLTFGGILSTIYSDTIKQEQITTLGVSEMVFLPDGLDCGNGCSYISSVQFTGFSPTATLSNASDILYCMVDIEHSYIGDIWINLTCPNGQRASLLKKYGTGSSGSCYSQIPTFAIGWSGTGTSNARFGIANTNDNSTYKCDPILNPPGTCWEYYWSNNPQYNYNAQYVYTGATGAVGVPSGFYHPDDNFSNLIGCPLNGNWSIQVMDGWGIDNGYLCGWELALNPDLIPQDWEFSQYITDVWSDNGDCNICPDSSGIYNIHIQDNLNCVYDTFVYVQVVQKPDVDLGHDYELCNGDVLILSGPLGFDSYWWNTGDTSRNIEVITTGEYILYAYTQEYGIICDGSDTIDIIYHPKPNLELDISDSIGCAPLIVCLIPNIENTSIWLYKDNQLVDILLGHSNIILEEPGLYSIKLTGVNEYGCYDSIWYNNCIIVHSSSEAAFEWHCNGLEVQFENLSIGDDFEWFFGDGFSSLENSPTHIYPYPGDYPVILYSKNEYDCTDSIGHVITVELPLIFPNVVTPNGDNINDIFAIENLVVDKNEFIPRVNELTIYNRYGEVVYRVKNYDTYSKNGEIIKGTKFWPNSTVQDGVYYFEFDYFGLEYQTYHGSITVIH